MNEMALCNLILGIVIGAIITAWMHTTKKPPLTVTVREDTEPGENSRLLNIEGNGPNGQYYTRDLFFAASILTHRLARESEEPFEDALSTFCECVRDIEDSMQNNPEDWTDSEYGTR